MQQLQDVHLHIIGLGYFLAALAALGLPWLIIDCFIHCVGFKAFQGKPEPRKTDGGHEEA